MSCDVRLLASLLASSEIKTDAALAASNRADFRKIVDRIEYDDEEYLILWDKDSNDKVVVVERNDKYELVDDEVADAVKFLAFLEIKTDSALAASNRVDFREFLADSDEDFSDEDLDSDESDFREFLADSDEDLDSDESDFSKFLAAFDEVLDDTMLKTLVPPVQFDSNKYILRSQDSLFKEGLSEYNSQHYEKAMAFFDLAHKMGNVYAAAHIGIMYYYGEGCEKNDKKAFQCFEEGYKEGCPLAAVWYSECFKMGCGVDKDKDYAARILNVNKEALRELCSVGDAEALYFLGFNLVMGIGGKVDKAEAVRLLETAVSKGHTRSAVKLAECYFNGWGAAEDAHKAMELLAKYPAPENKKYNYLLGRAYYYGDDVEKDYTKAFSYFEQSAKLGLGKAKDYLGDCYYYGQGVKKDLYEAARCYKDAADNHRNANAAHSLAFMYIHGEGVPKDDKKAVDYFMIAAEGGIVQAQRIISQEYVSGNILDRDYEAARVWIEKAVDRGDVVAQIILGHYYASDFGYRDDRKAFKLFEKAAATEHPKAMYELGVSYIEGRGTAVNLEKGIQHLMAATEKNSADACELLAKMYQFGIKHYNGQSNYTNLSEALVYARKFVELTDDAEAQCLLASILQESGNDREAKTWYQKAVDNNSESAKLALSKIYILGGTNYSDAVSMLETISSEQSGEAQYLLAYCLENGYGCKKDKRRAKALYRLAQGNGYTGNVVPRKRKSRLF